MLRKVRAQSTARTNTPTRHGGTLGRPAAWRFTVDLRSIGDGSPSARFSLTGPSGAEPMSTASVSVLIVAYDRLEYVGEALRSVGRPPSDGSSEVLLLTNQISPTVERICEEGSVRIVRLEAGCWGEWVLAALPKCRGEVLAFLDDDDLFEPGKVAAVASAFSDRPSLGYYHHRVSPFGPKGSIGHPLGPTAGRLTDGEKTAPRIDRLFWQLGGFNLSAIAVRRDLLASIPDLLRDLRVGHALALFYAGSIGPWDLEFDPAVRGRYRVHEGNQSIPSGTSLFADWSKSTASAATVARDADRIARYVEQQGDDRVSARPVRAVGARSRLIATLGDPRASRRAVLRAFAEFIGASPPRVTLDHRALVAVSSLSLLAPKWADRWAAGRSGPEPPR